MIVDNHAHVFPYLGGKSEYSSEEIQLMYAQKMISSHFEHTRRLEDYSIVDNAEPIWDLKRPGPEGKRDVNFRVGQFGRYEWTFEGIDYFKQYMPVTLQDMTASPEYLIAQMNYAGVKKAILQRGHIYGKLEQYYHRAISRFPDRFIGLAQIDESMAFTDEQISEMHRSVHELGLSGLYFEPGALFVSDFKYDFDDEIFESFWKEVDSLAIPLYVQTDRSEFLDQMERWRNILEKHPSIIVVVALGLPEQLALKDGQVHIPGVVRQLVKEYMVFLEVGYPISMGKDKDYPYPEAQELLKHLFDEFGPDKLIWGSDIPNVQRYCTYIQSLNYIRNYCDFLTDSDKEMILGNNVANLFKIDI
ncbi:MAG: amidohydrolase family protein [Planctomycetes bacterium]|nr:amidohydrolase family protein [Planctomycetota bacterium]